MTTPQDNVEIYGKVTERGMAPSCESCIHVATCGAYRAYAAMLNEMQRYEYLKSAPTKPETLAHVCKEYKTPSMIFNMKPLSV